MTVRRAVLLGLAGLLLAGGGYTAGAFREARTQAGTRLFGHGSRIDTSAGALEYAVAGDGPPLMMIHGTGGGFDQGLLFAAALRRHGFQIVAPSRFGYLGSAFPTDASPAHQADVLVELLDHLGIDQLPVVGGSAGALSAAEFALRHPDRCSHLVLLVPTLILSCEDDLFGTAATAHLLANRIPGSKLTIFPTGGHIWLGHDAEVADAISDFIGPHEAAPVEK